MKNTIIEFRNISKTYSKIKALDNISFKIPKNSIFGILGANGSGKSTLIKILPGLIQNYSGEILYNNLLVNKQDPILRKEFGYLIESPTFYEYLSAEKNLQILANISNIKKDRINFVLELVNLSKRASDKVSSYSYGMKQRLGIAQTLLHNPETIILDEPNNGLDPNGIRDMSKIIKNLRKEGKTICLSTHNLKEVEEICTHFTVLNKGKNSNTQSIQEQFQNSNKWIINIEEMEEAISIFKRHKKYNYINSFNKNIYVESLEKVLINEINHIVKDLNVNFISKSSNLIEYFNDN